jgi:DsbC/DsbD-like thiol-disulfide interchange protein
MTDMLRSRTALSKKNEGCADPAAALKRRMFARAAVLLLLASPAYAASDWSDAAKSRARLVSDAQGAGLEIELSPGAITYWRDPGEAGVPPTFDFAGSENLASAEVDFPAPERIPESDGSVAFGYRADVTLPIRLKAADPSKPVRLVAKVDYAVCEKICLPARAKAEIDWPGGSDAGLAEARAKVPKPVAVGALGVTTTATGPKSWRLCLTNAPQDLFVEAAEGVWIEPKREADGRCYALTLQQAPDDAKPPFAVRLTVEGLDGAMEMQATLGG